MVISRDAKGEMTEKLILALDTAFSTVVSTDRLDAMRRSAMARSVCTENLSSGVVVMKSAKDGV